MRRLHQVVLVFATLAGSWLALQAVHESGHVLAALLSGGRIERVVLSPLTISRTDLRQNPRPLLVAWAGPLFGALAPLLLWAAAAGLRLPGAFVLRFFAGACLLANGLYLGAGSFGRIGDCGVLLAHGAAIWQLWLFGALAAPPGLWLWHGQGRHFGLGPDAEPVSPAVAWTVLAVCLGLLGSSLLFGG